MKKIIFRTCVFLILTIGLFYIFDMVYTYLLTHSNNDKIWWAAKIKDKKYDFGFLGNSRAAFMVNTDTLEKRWGKKGVNLGIGGINIMEQYLIINKFYENRNSLSDIFIEVDIIDLGRLTSLKSQYRLYPFLPFITIDRHVYDEVKKNYGAKSAFYWRYLPFYRYIQFNSKIGSVAVLNCFLPIEKPDFDMETGDVEIYKISEKGRLGHIPLDYKPTGEKWEGIYSIQYYNYLERIIKVCEQNGTKVHLYTAPYFYLKYESCQNFNAVVDSAILPICKKYNADYKNFCGMKISHNPMCFTIDQNHITDAGMPIFMDSISHSYNLNTHSIIGNGLSYKRP